MRGQRAGGLAAVIVATAWLTHDLGSSRWNVHALLIAASAALFGLGIVNLVRLAVPRGSLAGPAVLIGVGGTGLALATHTITVRRLADAAPAAIIAVGVYAVLAKPTPIARVETGVRRYTALFWVRRPIKPDGRAPAVIVVRALFGSLTLDLSGLEEPRNQNESLVLDATVLFGRVALVTGSAWRVEPGRLHLTRAVHFDDKHAESPAPSARPLVLNVQGFCSALAVKLSSR